MTVYNNAQHFSMNKHHKSSCLQDLPHTQHCTKYSTNLISSLLKDTTISEIFEDYSCACYTEEGRKSSKNEAQGSFVKFGLKSNLSCSKRLSFLLLLSYWSSPKLENKHRHTSQIPLPSHIFFNILISRLFV